MPPTERYRPETLHEKLGDEFFDPVMAAEFPQHILRFRNQRCAARVGLVVVDQGPARRLDAQVAALPTGRQRPFGVLEVLRLLHALGTTHLEPVDRAVHVGERERAVREFVVPRPPTHAHVGRGRFAEWRSLGPSSEVEKLI